jgi:hypothetical protein
MKQSKLTLILALAIMVFTPSAVKPSSAVPATTTSVDDDYTYYFWFDLDGNFIRHCQTWEEIFMSGFDPYPYNPKTVQEKGYTVSFIYYDEIGTPHVPIGLIPDKLMYSHP